MNYIVTWKETDKVLYQYKGIVEADSEEEAKELVKQGDVNVIDSCELAMYEDEFIDFVDIHEDPDEYGE